MVEKWSAAAFDALIIDAFTGDAIPAHLITKEAFQTYLQRLTPNGLLAVNVSNQHADLKKVIVGHLGAFRVVCNIRSMEGPSVLGKYISHWVIIARRKSDLTAVGMEANIWSDIKPIYWRDDYSPLLPILR